MAGEGDHRDVLDFGISRARFLKLAGLGAGLSLFPGSLFSANVAGAQAVGVPEILDPTKYLYPIAAWWPPPPVPNTLSEEDVKKETDRRYEELAAAGFNTVIGGNGVSNIRASRLALEACAINGLRLVLDDTKLRNAIDPPSKSRSADQEEPESVLQALSGQGPQGDVSAQATTDRQAAIARRIQKLEAEFGGTKPGSEEAEYPALAGILLDDEPGKSLFPILKFTREEVEEVFGDSELPYVNVWPSHASPKNALEARSYMEYLEQYMTRVVPPFLSFDHYPLLADERLTADFFYNHAEIRRLALQFKVPSWGFVQSIGFDGRNVGLGIRRKPDEAEIFWQINVALAYGVKGIQYFTYWTPKNNQVKFGSALITRDRKKTALYGYATRANEFLQKVGRVLLPLTSVSVTHFGEKRLPRGAKPFEADGYVEAVSGSPAILGSFSDPNFATDRYVLVVNRSPNKAFSTRLTISGTVRSVERFDEESSGFVTETLAGDPPRFLTVSPIPSAGRAVLYRLRTAP